MAKKPALPRLRNHEEENRLQGLEEVENERMIDIALIRKDVMTHMTRDIFKQVVADRSSLPDQDRDAAPLGITFQYTNGGGSQKIKGAPALTWTPDKQGFKRLKDTFEGMRPIIGYAMASAVDDGVIEGLVIDHVQAPARPEFANKTYFFYCMHDCIFVQTRNAIDRVLALPISKDANAVFSDAYTLYLQQDISRHSELEIIARASPLITRIIKKDMRATFFAGTNEDYHMFDVMAKQWRLKPSPDKP